MGRFNAGPLWDHPAPAPSRWDAFKTFHTENPGVFDLFRKFAAAARQRRPRFGARMIGERIRWYTSIETTDAEYKLNDHIWPYYARMLIVLDQTYGDFFELRDKRFDTTMEQIKRFAAGETL